MMDFGLALDRAREDAAVVERYEAALRNEPQDRKLRLGLQAARRKAQQSQATLEQYSHYAQVDLVSYRIERVSDEYPLLSVAESISSFQRAFISLADAMLNGPKDRASYASEIRKSATLNFGYSFPGSQGLVFSIPNERDIFQSGTLDLTVQALHDFLDVKNSDEARDATRHLGLAAVGQLYEWIDTNVSWENNVEYIWTRSDYVKSGEYVSREKFGDVKDILKSAVEPSTIELEVSGVLVGLDVNTRRFHIVTSDDEDISGKLDVDFQQTAALVGQGSRYRARIKETEKRFAATGRVDRTYTLLALSADG